MFSICSALKVIVSGELARYCAVLYLNLEIRIAQDLLGGFCQCEAHADASTLSLYFSESFI